MYSAVSLRKQSQKKSNKRSLLRQMTLLAKHVAVAVEIEC
jgi:hypothetical protein